MRIQHVLLVATPSTRQALRPLLASHSEFHLAAEASTFEEAGHVLAMLRVDLVLLETELGGEDGFEFLPSIAIDTRVICLAAGARDMMRASTYGSLQCVPLPVRRDALDEALDVVLGRNPVASSADFSFAPYHLPGEFSL